MNIIKNFHDFLNEAVVPQAVNGIFLLSASTSSSDIGPDLATKLGVEKDKSYTFTISTLGQIAKIAKELKFNGAQSKTGQGTPVKPGQDILTVNGKTVNETGSIILTKAEFPAGQPVQITASNNGFLCLMRLGDAFNYMVEKSGLGITAKNWAIKLTMGGNPTEKDARGFSVYSTNPSSLTAASNTLASNLAIIILNANGAAGNIPSSDTENWGKLQKIKDVPVYQAISTSAQFVATILVNKDMLVNAKPLVNMTNIQQLGPGILAGSGQQARTLTSTGAALAKAVMLDIAKAIAPTQMPANWSQEAQSVFTDFTEIITNGLAAADVAESLRGVQLINTYTATKSVPTQTVQATQQQGEGLFGR